MSGGKTPMEEAEAAIAELKALTRKAHEAAQLLSERAKVAHEQCEGYVHGEVQRALDGYTATMQLAMDTWNASAKADGQRVIDRLSDACEQVVTVVNLQLVDEAGKLRTRADVVIDLRGQVPAFYRGDDPAGQAILDQAEYRVMIDPQGQSLRDK